jgi:hypothetical protein
LNLLQKEEKREFIKSLFEKTDNEDIQIQMMPIMVKTENILSFDKNGHTVEFPKFSGVTDIIINFRIRK